jgi:hypothetical protein
MSIDAALTANKFTALKKNNTVDPDDIIETYGADVATVLQ